MSSYLPNSVIMGWSKREGFRGHIGVTTETALLTIKKIPGVPLTSLERF
jgi:hypothetical protein